jgi:hypothetical protein
VTGDNHDRGRRAAGWPPRRGAARAAPLSAVLLLLPFLLLLAAPAAAQQAVGRVETAVGRVLLLRGGVTPVALAADPSVHEGDVVRTGEASRARLLFLDGTVVQLGERSDLTVTRWVSGPAGRDGLLDLPLGWLRAVVSRIAGPSSARVVTTTAVAAVRSTDLAIEAGPDSTAVFVGEGAVEVGSAAPGVAGTVLLRAGEGTQVPRGRPPDPPTAWGAGRVRRTLDATAVP